MSFAGDLSNPGIEPRSPALQSDSLPTELQGKPANHKANVQARLQGSEGRVCQQVELWVQRTGQQVMEPTLGHSGGEQQLGGGAEGSSRWGALVGTSRGCLEPPWVSSTFWSWWPRQHRSLLGRGGHDTSAASLTEKRETKGVWNMKGVWALSWANLGPSLWSTSQNLQLLEQSSKGTVLHLVGTKDRFCGRQFFHGWGGVGLAWGWFKCMHYSPPGSSVHGILQVKILE